MIYDDKKYRIKLKNFEGPYDLLLYLIKQNEIEIHDINISEILSQYIEYLNFLSEKDFNPDEIVEFFLVAATLMRIKANSLLPKSNINDEYIDEITARKLFIEKLIQYQYFKYAALFLEKRKVDVLDFEKKCFYEKKVRKELRTETLSLESLLKSFQKFLFKISIDELIKAPKYKVEDFISDLKIKLRKNEVFDFSKYIRESKTKLELITKFIALLELLKEGKYICIQNGTFGRIMLKRKS